MAHKSNQKEENIAVIRQQELDDGEWKESSENEVWINEKLKSNLRAIMSLHPEGLPASQLCREYFKYHGVELDARYWGCYSVAEFCAILPQVFTMVRGGKDGSKEDWVLYSKAKVGSDSSYSQIDYGSTGSGVVIPHIKTGSGVVIPHIGKTSSTFSNLKTDHVIGSRSDFKLNKKRAYILGPNDKIPRQGLPDNVSLGEFLEVVVAEVVSPEKFWIQLKGKDTNKALVWLMEEIKQFYGKSFQEYKVHSEDFLSGGLVCASLHTDGYWYRAVVTAFQDLTTVEVFFIDYGNVFKVKKSSLAYLHRRFGKLPGQAFEACLDGIKPAGGLRDFPKEATRRFLQLTDVFTEETEYLGLIAVVRGLGERLSVVMVDTCTNDLPQGIVINQVLVDEGFAVPEASFTNHVMDKVNSWLDQMLKVNLGTDNSIDCELMEQLKLTHEKPQDSRQPKVLHSVKMGGLDCHIVVKEGSAWMTSREVSRFIPNWKGRNILPRMLQLKRMDVSSLTVTANTQWSQRAKPLCNSDPTLHASLKGALKDENCKEIILYPLKSIPHILDLFLQVPGTHLRLALRSQIENFERINEQNF